MSANWWEAAPLVNEPTPEPAKKKKEQNWWEEAPLLGEATAAPEAAPVSPEQQSPISFGPLGMLVESVRSMKAGAEGQQTVNPILGATARGAELIGSALETTARLGEAAPETLTATGPAISAIKSVAPKLQEWADSFRNWGQEIDYAPSTKLGDLADNPATVVPFVVERVITSSPDMLAASVALPAYIPTRANEILNERLKNDKRTLDEATIGDVAAAAAAATVEGTLERFATRQLGTPEGILRPTALQAGTEAVEEVGAYAGETAGTKEGFDPRTAALTGAEAAIVGGGLGGTIATGTELIRRNIESRVRDLEGLGTDIEKRELQRLRDQAFESAQTIAAPELPEVTPVQYGDAYAQRVYDSLGQYIPVNTEFKVEEKAVDGAPRFVVTDKTGIQYGQVLDDKAKADAFALSLNSTTKERADLVKQLEPLQSSLKSVMKGFGLSDMGLTLSDRIFTRRGEALTSEGLFDPIVRRVFLAVDAIDPNGTLDTNQRREALRGVLRHEVVHALRYLDLWKRSEWKNLENTVGRLKKQGTDQTYLDIAKENYSDQNQIIQIEEAVADMIRDVADRQAKVAGRPRSLSERAINFFDKAKNALTGAGFQTYEDIVQRFEQGDIGARERGKIRTFRATEEQQAARGEVPERLQQLFKNPEERNKFRNDTVQNLWGQTKPASPFTANTLRSSGIRESRAIVDPIPPKIKINEQEVPTRDSEGRLIYSGYEGPEMFGTQTAPTQEGLTNFWNWFGKSKATDKQGRPMAYYHGTAADITEFVPKQAGSVFVTTSPDFAEGFSFYSDNYMVSNFPDFMSDQQVVEVLDETLRNKAAFSPQRYDAMEEARNLAVSDLQQGKAIRPSALKKFKQVAEAGLSSRYLNAIQKRLPSSANLMPVYVKAENPFDYENPEHVNRVVKEVNRISPVKLDSGQIEGLKAGDWGTIEGPMILETIKDLGFDSMYVEEQGNKNLAVFNPEQIKSAIGNNGQFSPTTPSIRESRKRQEPVSPLQGIITPEEAEGRIRRRLAREPGVGAPRNERIVLTSPSGQTFVTGKITTQDWLNRVQSLFSQQEIQDSRGWYRQLDEAFRPIFGNETPKWALAWLMSQKRASPTKGFTDVLRAADIAAGKAKVKGAGLNEQALIDVLQDKVPEGGIGAKLLDFLDSELGKTTRTVVRGDARGRQPAAIDVWAQRDIGFLDETTLEFIRKNFGDEVASQLQSDKTTSGESQYEYGIDFYNDVAEMLNDMKFDGGKWTAAEVQAVGWVAMQRAMGVQAEFVRDIIGGNTRRISIGLAPGANSVLSDKLAGKEIPPEVAQREIDFLANLSGIRVKQNVAGVGAYLQWVEGAIQIDSVASPEAVDDFMDMVGYVFQQTEIINTRSLPSGKNMAIDIMSPGLGTVDASTSFFSKFLEYAPKDKGGDPIAPGFQQITTDGMPGIRLLNFAGNWRSKQVDQILEAANKAAADMDMQLDNALASQVVLTSTKNDWSKDKDGQAYLDSLRNRGRLQEVELLQRRYPPSRIDIQGDGSILWGRQEREADTRTGIAAEGAIVPQAREARRRRPPGETPLGPTVPGPSTDSDTTAASEALNSGEPTNGFGMPTGPLVTDTMPDNTVDISRARLEPITRRLIRTVEFFQSAPDKLRSGVGLTDIAKRIEDYYDTYAERLGVVNAIIREANKKISFGRKREALDTFEEFIRARENGRTDEAAAILNNASESDRQLIDAWNQIAEETGRVNLSVRTPNGQPMKVYDPNLVTGTYGEGVGGFRPIRAVKQFFPRTLRREVLEVMMNSDKDPALYNELLDALIASGRVETREEADKYLTKEWFSDEIKQDYFAGVEKARTDPLPEVFYDYSWDAATRYLRKWARRTSQIQYFGQEMGQFQKDWFDTNIPKIRDDETQEYLNEIKNRVYEIESFDFISNVGNWLNSLATATQLGNPVSASLNLLGGTITNVQEFGIKEIAKSYADLLLDWKKVQAEGTRLGILNTDVMNILSDHVEQDAQKYFSKTQKVSEALAKFTNFTLTFGGFNGAENVVRASAMLAARSWLNDSLIAVNQDPGSKKAKKFYEWVNRENLNADQLILENGSGPETAKFMRRAVNVPQGSYKIDMTPVFVDTTAGRFFLKYQKFGTQINRFFYRHFLKPFREDPTPTRLLRILGFLGSAIVGGGAILAIREAFGYGDPGPDKEEIWKALWENEDLSRAWDLILSRAWQNISAAGSMGNFANYAQFSMDWQDQLKPKNPLSPPGLASIDAVVDLLNRIRDQKSFSARDLDEIAEGTLSFYRAYKRIGLASLEEMGSDAKAVKAFATRKETREIRELSRRYSDEMEMEYKRRTAPGSIIRTPMTPINRKVIDALYAGDGLLARQIIREAQKGLPKKEREKIIRSIQSAARNAQPIQIAGVAPSREIRRDFDRWARKNLPREKVQLINRVDKNYKRAARLAGLKIGE